MLCAGAEQFVVVMCNEVPVMGMERRDCIIQFWTAVNLGNKGGTNGQNKPLGAG